MRAAQVPRKSPASVDDGLAQPAHQPQKIGHELTIQIIPNPPKNVEQIILIPGSSLLMWLPLQFVPQILQRIQVPALGWPFHQLEFLTTPISLTKSGVGSARYSPCNPGSMWWRTILLEQEFWANQTMGRRDQVVSENINVNRHIDIFLNPHEVIDTSRAEAAQHHYARPTVFDG